MPKKKDETATSVPTSTEDVTPNTVDHVEDAPQGVPDGSASLKIEVDPTTIAPAEISESKKFDLFVGLRLKDKAVHRGFTAVVQSPGAIADMWACAIYDASGDMKGVYTMHQNAIWVMYEPADNDQKPPKDENKIPEERNPQS